jgi:hypothetical protein
MFDDLFFFGSLHSFPYLKPQFLLPMQVNKHGKKRKKGDDDGNLIPSNQ